MRFGVCIGSCIGENAYKLEKLKQYGYDYAELGLSTVAEWTQEDIAAARAEMDRLGIYGEACNGFFPFEKGYLTGKDMDLAVVEEYTRRALGKAARLGLKVAVLGSGKARYINDESDRAAGEERFVQVLRIAGDIAAEYGVEIAIEPLRYGETNFINTVADSLEMVKRADRPNVFTLADFYHVAMNEEPLDTIRSCGDLLRHVHIARSNPDRMMPVNPEDQPACAAWAAALKENGYDRRISLEGGLGDMDETLPKMRQVLKQFE